MAISRSKWVAGEQFEEKNKKYPLVDRLYERKGRKIRFLGGFYPGVIKAQVDGL